MLWVETTATPSDIAEQCGVSINTVYTVCRNVKRKYADTVLFYWTSTKLTLSEIAVKVGITERNASRICKGISRISESERIQINIDELMMMDKDDPEYIARVARLAKAADKVERFSRIPLMQTNLAAGLPLVTGMPKRHIDDRIKSETIGA
jgi:DNA-binding CsgD family transcriptional regulator